MTTSIKKTLIAASVGAVLAAGSFSAMAGTPGTTNLLFPFITTENGAFTFISISQQGGAAGAHPLHFTYSTKAASAPNSATCSHLDGDATTTANDLLQFEVANKVPMTGFGGTSTAKFYPSSTAGANQRGMLIVNNDATANYGSGATYAGATLYGEARIINTAAGLAAAYSTDDLHTTGSPTPDFTLPAGPDGGVGTKVISWFPEPAVTTSFYVLPLGTEQAMAFSGNVATTYQAQNAALGFGGHYNNKEGFQSSTAVASVTCFGTFSRAGLLGDLNAAFSANGGWANFASTAGATNALIYKLETTNALGGTTSFITRAPVR